MTETDGAVRGAMTTAVTGEDAAVREEVMTMTVRTGAGGEIRAEETASRRNRRRRSQPRRRNGEWPRR